MQTQSPWFKPSRRDFIVAGIGSIFGGGAMFIYDSFVIDDLYDEIEDLGEEDAPIGLATQLITTLYGAFNTTYLPHI